MGKKSFTVELTKERCKECGICIEFCPQQVFERGEDEKSQVVRVQDCIGCRLCEYRCPDFAIRVEEGGEQHGED